MLLLLIVSCNKEEEIVPLHVSSIRLIDAGQITHNYSFNAAIVGDSTCECKISTVLIKKGDSIATISAFVQGKELHIDITSSPYDFDCNEDSCFTVHDVYFNLNLVNQKEYYVTPMINNSDSEKGNPFALTYLIK